MRPRDVTGPPAGAPRATSEPVGLQLAQGSDTSDTDAIAAAEPDASAAAAADDSAAADESAAADGTVADASAAADTGGGPLRLSLRQLLRLARQELKRPRRSDFVAALRLVLMISFMPIELRRSFEAAVREEEDVLHLGLPLHELPMLVELHRAEFC